MARTYYPKFPIEFVLILDDGKTHCVREESQDYTLCQIDAISLFVENITPGQIPTDSLCFSCIVKAYGVRAVFGEDGEEGMAIVD